MINRLLPKITDKLDFSQKKMIVSYINVYNYKILRKHPSICNAIDLFTLDGIALSVVLRFFFGKKIKRKSPDFSSYFSSLFKKLNDSDLRVFIIGGDSKDINVFIQTIKRNFPKINIAGYCDGYNIQEKALFNEILDVKTDVLIAGLGTPKQERFLVDLKDFGYNGISFACGAFVSQTANKGIQYYPKLINKLHLRWLFRIYKEPSLIKRYTIDYPKGVMLLLKDKYAS